MGPALRHPAKEYAPAAPGGPFPLGRYSPAPPDKQGPLGQQGGGPHNQRAPPPQADSSMACQGYEAHKHDPESASGHQGQRHFQDRIFL